MSPPEMGSGPATERGRLNHQVAAKQTQADGTAVFGVLELSLADLDHTAGVPVGVRVRVQLGGTRHVRADQLTTLAARTFGGCSVEVVGRHADAIRVVVDHLRRRHAEWRATEQEHAREQARRDAALWGDVA